ncbi:uncharacterized protein MKZ38_001645 [Zalerion maritima]|uniref:Uncharacterized protein n=1 Tax=Zalerion maritima TaxID=339359 RepID=A0AAD5WRD4_9PEZI|nr:uncharacterized protein MKZ38_001645 [Zalerion maritima]
MQPLETSAQQGDLRSDVTLQADSSRATAARLLLSRQLRDSDGEAVHDIYKLDIVEDHDAGHVQLVMPRQRMLKNLNGMDVVSRATASINKGVSMSLSLIDITAVSFAMRSALAWRRRGQSY